MVNFKRLLNTGLGRFFISVLLGLGLATLFHKVCTDKSCINFNGPVISDIENKIYKHDNSCYKYTSESVSCDAKKQIVDISVQEKVAAPTSAKKLGGIF